MVAFGLSISAKTFYFGKSGVGKLDSKIVLPAPHCKTSEETKITITKLIALFLLGMFM
jgi:hypothetical protein